MTITTDTVLKILCLPNVGRKTARKLLNLLNQTIRSDNELIEFVQENAELLHNPLVKSDFINAFEKADLITHQSLNLGIELRSCYDHDYPKLLKITDDAPLLISTKGNYDKIHTLPSVAIIGTRQPTESGSKIAQKLGETFGKDGFNVVSGLALGCDTAGHEGCLTASGYTTAILAHGLDQTWPVENTHLATRIVEEGGLLVSEYLIGQKPQFNHFVERNRIQAGLSHAVIVVETAIKSGTMHTVKFAHNYQRIIATLLPSSQYSNLPETLGNQFLIDKKLAKPLSDEKSIELLKMKILESYSAL